MSKTFTVTFLPQKKKTEVPEGTTILAAEQMAGLEPDAPCGGNGKCGKCRVEILEGKKTGVVLACQTPVDSDMKIDTMLQEKVQRILAEGKTRSVPVDPGITLTDPDSGRPYYLMAFDIGTTTVVGYLLDGKDGHEAGVASMMNPQHQFGADVISRANYVLENGGEQMRKVIVDALNQLIGKACTDAGILREDIIQISIVGNTCMHHLFLGISPASLVHAPYTPAVSERLVLNAGDYGLDVQRKAELIMLPDIAGYVGADTCGCLLALRQDQKDEISLMIDIGTNGEMVLGNRNRLVTCSTAAGPAFEGAKIECGMRGAAGAVDHVKYENGKWDYTTVGNQPAVGLCGSGLIDLVAGLLDAGMLDENGALSSGQEKQGVFMLVPLEQAGNERGVYLTQKDIGEVQLAKAAIAAGIQMLMKRLGITEEEICSVYIAGAFGNYMDPVSAGKIGLLPAALVKKVKPVGNAAGEGAKIALVNEREMLEMDELVGKIDFVELAASGDFQDYFIDELGFEANE